MPLLRPFLNEKTEAQEDKWVSTGLSFVSFTPESMILTTMLYYPHQV